MTYAGLASPSPLLPALPPVSPGLLPLPRHRGWPDPVAVMPSVVVESQPFYRQSEQERCPSQPNA